MNNLQSIGGPVWPADRVVVSTHRDGVVFFNLASSQLYAANAVGAIVWSELEKHHSPHDIARTISADFDVPLEVAVDGVQQFLAELHHQKLIILRAES